MHEVKGRVTELLAILQGKPRRIRIEQKATVAMKAPYPDS